MHTVPNWHLQCYTYNRHSGGYPVASVLTELALECSVPSSAQLLSGTGVSSALQCLAFRWHFSAPVPQCLTVTVTRSPNLGWERAGNAKKCVY